MQFSREPSQADLFISMLCREQLATDFELASIAHDALYALRVKGLPLETVQAQYSKAIEAYIEKHNWD